MENYVEINITDEKPFFAIGDNEKFADEIESDEFLKHFCKHELVEEEEPRFTEFTDQPSRLFCGRYITNDHGIKLIRNGKTIFNFPHPITISKVLKDVDSGFEKIEIAYKPRNDWQYIMIKRETLSTGAITRLSNYGVAVNQNNVKELINYFSFLLSYNKKSIKINYGIDHFGYIKGLGFSPFSDKVIFTDIERFGGLYNSIRTEGDYANWKYEVLKLTSTNNLANLVLCASFASVLINLERGLPPFFIHLYGNDSETGKSTLQRIAASVWGYPEEYMTRFGSTSVGLDIMASTLNHLPFIIEELQLEGNQSSTRKFDPYELAQGKGKLRGNKDLSLRKITTWSNTIITSGEGPLADSTRGAGAHNRIIDIEVNSTNRLGDKIYLTKINQFFLFNYGYAGREFVDYIFGENSKVVQKDCHKIYQYFCDEISKTDTTGKQTKSICFILMASQMIAKTIFKGFNYTPLTIEYVLPFLKTSKDIDIVLKAYEIIMQLVNKEQNKFQLEDYDNCYSPSENINVFGVISNIENKVWINRAIFDGWCKDYKLDGSTIAKGLKERNMSFSQKNRTDTQKKIGSTKTHCICLKIDLEK